MPSERQPLRQIMDNNAATSSADPDAAARRRRSGRVSRVPDKFAPEPSNAQASKRKRDDDAEDDENDVPELDEEDSDESSDGDGDASDQDHEPASSRRARKAQPSRSRKPAVKKPKTNGAHTSGANRAITLPRMPKRSARLDTGDKTTGLYAEIFGSGDTGGMVAQQWLERYRQDRNEALLGLINCILQCIGCEHEVTIDDVQDPDNIPNRLTDLQDAYLEQQEVDYPLISKARTTRTFRELLVGFFKVLVDVLHESEVLYKDPELMDNLHAWLSSMSSSSLRAFRHTGTTVALAVTSGLVAVAHTLDYRITTIEQQLQASKRSTAKAKSFEIGLNLNEATEYRGFCSDTIQSFFDTVFVHRYRDTDPVIRTECVEALGNWIWDLPTTFMEPSYLRYLGWMLSDTNLTTRQEVLKQLGRVLKRDAAQLGHFVDRFRERIVEMATSDKDVAPRVASISVVDALREAALLEPAEIDRIGELIFDSEPRVRRAVVGFFVACIEEAHEGKVDELGGSEVLDEYDHVEEDDYESPRREWVSIKCLAETLSAYDAQIEDRQQDDHPIRLAVAVDLLGADPPETRVSLAAQVLYDKVDEVRDWQLLAGYLMHDHTTSKKSASRSKAASHENAFKKAVAPEPAEEAILLKVLVAAIKTDLEHTAELDKGKRRGQRMEAPAAQERIAEALLNIIPRLLNKFGADPEPASTVLHLEHYLNISMSRQLRSGGTKYAKLLDEMCTQFTRHNDPSVVSRTVHALLHARQHEDSEELVDERLDNLWDTCVASLRSINAKCELSKRGNLDADSLQSLSTVIMKISRLAGIASCVDVLDAQTDAEDPDTSVLNILLETINRGKYDPQDNEEIDDLEDEVVSYALKACGFYFMWRVQQLVKLLGDGNYPSMSDVNLLSSLRQKYRRHTIVTFSSRAAVDELRIFATGCLCELHVFFSSLREHISKRRSTAASDAQRDVLDQLELLAPEIEPTLVPEIFSIFEGAEKAFAKRSKRVHLNAPAEDEEPINDEEEEDDDDDEDEAGLSEHARLARQLQAEKALCRLTAFLVVCINLKLLDSSGAYKGRLRKRLLRNRNKLGKNFSDVVAHLDKKNALPRAAQSAKKSTTTAQESEQQPAREPEPIDDDDEDEEQAAHNDDPFASGDERDREAGLDFDPIDDEPDEAAPPQRNNDVDDDILGD
ncbi:Cohesin subunit-like protein [Emericellopsis cladophorae]|uniref:Cohesin subunit-like protein n=1 Tax=Emericellopsis cladophorae TaxID=2686198 RepID=A0A9P9Y4F5_9HYPO|nr:Cohesin subunit-like protein [Emericellopsis cladophorae]KAI6782918.1 Cohesin subunit-like protein [Emericellopsis cladophorae]